MPSNRLLLAVLLAAQFCLFWQFANREIVWAYASGFDQTAYLTVDYELSQEVRHDGPFTAIGHYLERPRPTGFMLPLQWNILQFFTAPNRLSALTLNFAYFALLEVIFWLTACHLAGRAAFGWIGVGLLLAQRSAFLVWGGLFDCRIDFIAYDLYGVFVCCLVRSDGLRDRRWCAAAGGCAVLLMTFRFITFAYFLGFCCTLFTLLLGGWLVWRRRWGVATVLRLAMKRTLALGAVVLAVGGVLIAINWKAIHDYYVVGHLTGNEKSVRAAEAGITKLSDHLTFYVSSLYREHLGTSFVVLSVCLLAAGALVRISRPRRTVVGPHGGARQARWLVSVFVLVASLFAPWFILTLDTAKSPIVINVLAPATALLVLLLVAGLRRPEVRRAATGASPVAWGPRWGWRMAAVAVVAIGFSNWLVQLTREGPFAARRESVEQINALYDCIDAESRRLEIASPRIGTDLVMDWNAPTTLNVSVWERHGRWLAAQSGFGYAIMDRATHERLPADLEAMDAMLLSTLPKVGTYPIIQSIQPLEGEIDAWCESHLLPVRTFEIDGGRVTLYMRPGVRYEGLSGDWIAAEGFRLHVPAETLDRMRASGHHVLTLKGWENPEWLKDTPVASAQLVGYGDPACPASFTRPTRGTYRIRLDLTGPLMAVPAGAEAVVAVHLNGADFFPPDVGINDMRHLVVPRPSGLLLE